MHVNYHREIEGDGKRLGPAQIGNKQNSIFGCVELPGSGVTVFVVQILQNLPLQ